MRFTPTPLPGVVLIEPQAFEDGRGLFMETYHRDKFREGGIDATFVQDNHSVSHQGVLRGLHYQIEKPQGKLVRVVRGAVFDVAVDIRKGSPTFGQWYGVRLSETDRRMLYVPPGFAHGFCALTDDVHFLYKCTELYAPELDRGIRWNDPQIGIAWPVDRPSLSPKDAALPLLRELPENELFAYDAV